MCNGTLNATSKVCIHKKTLLTNLTGAPNLMVEGGNATFEDIADRQASVAGPVAYCPPDKPFAVEGKKCVGCSEPLICFDLVNMTCGVCPWTTNLEAVNQTGRFIEDENHTLAGLSEHG